MKHPRTLAAFARWACCLVIALVVVQACSSGPSATQVARPGSIQSFCPVPFALSNGGGQSPGWISQQPDILDALARCAAGGLANLGRVVNSTGCVPNPSNANCPPDGKTVAYRPQPMELPLDLQPLPGGNNDRDKPLPLCPLDQVVDHSRCKCPSNSIKDGNRCKPPSATEQTAANERAAAQRTEIVAAMRFINDALRLGLTITEARKP